MSISAADTSVHASIVVNAPLERAFRTFTEGIGEWWPPEHHLLEAELAEMTFEPRAGGRILDRGVDGSESCWSRVLVYEPPQRVVLSWDVSVEWRIESDPERTSEVEVTFTPEGAGRTRVDLEHRRLERHGEGWESMRDSVGSPNGWQGGLKAFAAHIGG